MRVGLGDDGASAFARGGRLASFCGLLIIWPLMVVAILVKVKMPGGPALTFGRACSRSAMLKQAWTLLSLTRSLFLPEARGKDGKLFTCHKFRTMVVAHNGSSVSVSGDLRITPLGAKLYFD